MLRIEILSVVSLYIVGGGIRKKKSPTGFKVGLGKSSVQRVYEAQMKVRNIGAQTNKVVLGPLTNSIQTSVIGPEEIHAQINSELPTTPVRASPSYDSCEVVPESIESGEFRQKITRVSDISDSVGIFKTLASFHKRRCSKKKLKKSVNHKQKLRVGNRKRKVSRVSGKISESMQSVESKSDLPVNMKEKKVRSLLSIYEDGAIKENMGLEESDLGVSQKQAKKYAAPEQTVNPPSLILRAALTSMKKQEGLVSK